ncbi:hypothetical protein Pint_14756 [Pistacia integerrima]|uniref:Uncharacterized protein n=1 Tax=Pistacia integerrima TaxID=434235 RepID=A0ACC0Y8U5_9ROSI|nr:hypothetical protein Pint_14756 [Pistacia integerrima]
MMPRIIIIVAFYIFLSKQLGPSIAQTNWIRVGYYWYSSGHQFLPISDINSALFTHVICAYATVNSTSYQLSLSPANEERLSTFTDTVKRKNPSVSTLLSVGGPDADYSTFSSMAKNCSYRKSFIYSSIKIARLYSFQGLDFAWQNPNTSSDMFSMGILFQGLKAAIGLEAKNSNQSQLILTARVNYSPMVSSAGYPTVTMQQHLNWVHVVSSGYTSPDVSNLTGAHAALYNPSTVDNTDYGIREWINGGLSANKLVLCLPFYGYAWALKNPIDNGIGAPATGCAIDVFLTYREIKNYIDQYGPDVHVRYNSTDVVNYWTKGKIWIGFDDVDAIRAKVAYAKEKKLLGYYVWQVSSDVNWVLSRTAGKLNELLYAINTFSSIHLNSDLYFSE